MDKGTRMERTARHVARARKIWLASRVSYWYPPEKNDEFRKHALGHFRKYNGGGCGCRRSPKGKPKIAASCCHGFGLHPSVRERKLGRSLCRAWIGWVRENAPDDFVEGRFVRDHES